MDLLWILFHVIFISGYSSWWSSLYVTASISNIVSWENQIMHSVLLPTRWEWIIFLQREGQCRVGNQIWRSSNMTYTEVNHYNYRKESNATSKYFYPRWLEWTFKNLKWNSYNIELILLKWAIQWHLVYSFCCIITTSF